MEKQIHEPYSKYQNRALFPKYQQYLEKPKRPLAKFA